MKTTSENSGTKTDPVPTRFFRKEADFLARAKLETGYPVSELIRRFVRLGMHQEAIFGSCKFVSNFTP